MKSIQRCILFSLVPLLTPLNAFAEAEEKTTMASPVDRAKSNAAFWRASEVIGQSVKNSNDETIGEVQDLLVDMKSGQIHAMVIFSGGFLGMGDSFSADPVYALRFDTVAKAFKTKFTKEQLDKAPQFKTTAWPNLSPAGGIR